MTRFLVGSQDVFDDPSALRVIDAESKERALLAYRRCVFPVDPDFLENLADKAVNLSFVERFWLSTPEEQHAFGSGGNVIATEAVFASRVFAAFVEQRDLARQYIQYQLDNSEPDVTALPVGLAEFVAANNLADDWSRLFVLPLDDIPEKACKPDPAVAAIEFALRTDEGMEFLRCWLHGEFPEIRKEWPDAPEAVFVGADLLHPETKF